MKNNKLYFSLVLFMFFVSFFAISFFTGCEKELATNEIGVNRTFKGRVVEYVNPNQGIPGATVNITVRVGNNFTETTTTDAYGNFSVVLPAYSDPKVYFLRVEKEGYSTVDTFVNCSCEILVIPTLKLKPVNCKMKVPGLVDIKTIVAVGDSLDFVVDVSNDNVFNVNLDSVFLTTNDIKLIAPLPLPQTIPSKGTKTFTFRFKPTTEKLYQDSIKWKFSCDEELRTTFVFIRAEYRRCNVFALKPVAPDTIYLKVGVVDTGYVVVRNISNTLSLFYNQTLLPNPVYFDVVPTVVPPNRREIVSKLGGNDDTIRVIVKSKSFSNRKVDSMVINTFGFCDKKIWIIADSTTANIRLAVLMKWAPSPSTNPKYEFTGLKFSDWIPRPEYEVATSNRISFSDFCQGSLVDSIDVKFNGFDLLGRVNIQAFGGLQWLGKSVTLDGTYKNKINKNPGAWANKGCNSQFELFDIIAIRWVDNPNKFAIIQISNLITDPATGYQSIYIKYYPDIDLIQ